jgi:hypothetical protein
MDEKDDKSHRNLFFQKQRLYDIFPWLNNFLNLRDNEDDVELEESSDESEGSEMEIDVYNN